ncbi:hypothetical protein RclHR1_06200019 [Rhizophagus clarus]|uniref:Uncharacterized protein n=1 Tax=Rhizophagus clarus TaxID=94130 RepID=A0A2Z6RRW1_9GLOM|nr:hypothetical protein RclHR1_06200019 [Rhizophagus clarus]
MSDSRDNQNAIINQNKKKHDHPKTDIWDYFKEGPKNRDHCLAECNFYSWKQQVDQPIEMQGHIALNCLRLSFKIKTIFLEKIANNNSDYLKQHIKKIITRRFFMNIEELQLIFKPIKEVIKYLEMKNATLADCFLQLIKLSYSIKNLSGAHTTFRQQYTIAFNKRWMQFDFRLYMLAYLLYPLYHKEEFDIEDEDYDDTEDKLVDIEEYKKFGHKSNDNILQTENYFNLVSKELVELLKLQESQAIIEPVKVDHIVDHGNKNFDIEKLLDKQFSDN